MSMPARRLCLFFAVLALATGLAAPATAADGPRAMPFNDQSVFNYFKNVQEQAGDTDKPMTEEEYTTRKCTLYSVVMKQAGYDFEATVRSAATKLVKGGDPLRNPRFKFLAGVFQVHPREFLKRKLISQETYAAVMAVLEQ
ncbi:hypothetical protein [Desulfolutivibrio sulfoxidireducens]|uniref:hypothetical protein n=1 Tax=Desulfolutivibrio sulfoxidireducens TaxID=2773299 RepID=UPI00159EB360|nr:hypothetical protein [Desulfolutivibrio sulfoxidireducens]QLA17536.1 hypothetical protein GD605_16330 [Desulfolutivibrio sulfoxidireducens]QLA21122.1 hypothetical protein GD604_16025 [Desulfolutivibrio sulfoxidireducens]